MRKLLLAAAVLLSLSACDSLSTNDRKVLADDVAPLVQGVLSTIFSVE